MVDVDGAAAKCTCPSRKFPCKHGIGLMLLAAAGSVGQSGTEPDDVAAWLNDRTRRAAAAAERTSAAPGAPGATTAEPDEKTARARERDRQRRAAQREERVTAGMDDFRRWLRDLARRGLADVADPGAYEAAAARLVDAQAGELARDVRALGRTIARRRRRRRDGPRPDRAAAPDQRDLGPARSPRRTPWFGAANPDRMDDAGGRPP